MREKSATKIMLRTRLEAMHAEVDHLLRDLHAECPCRIVDGYDHQILYPKVCDPTTCQCKPEGHEGCGWEGHRMIDRLIEILG